MNPYRSNFYPSVRPSFWLRLFAFFAFRRGGQWVEGPDGLRYVLPDPLPPETWFGPWPW